MRTCAYCGKENDDISVACAECGTALSIPTQDPASGQNGFRWRDVLADPVRLFRALVAVSTVAYVIWVLHLRFGGQLISENTWTILSWNGYGALLPMPPRLGWLFLPLFIAVAVGLWVFARTARLLFLMLTLFFIVTSPLAGVQVQTALGSFLVLLTDLADGAILVMAYTAPLRERFR